MKSAREIADDLASSSNDYECAWRIQEAIHQAREDGARWMQTTIVNGDDDGFGYNPADVRKVAP